MPDGRGAFGWIWDATNSVWGPQAGTSGGSTYVTTPNSSSWSHAHKTVGAAGTAEQLGSIAPADGFAVVIRAVPANTGNIYVGSSKANAESAALRITLAKGEAVELFIDDSDLVWVDAAVAGEGVEYWAET